MNLLIYTNYSRYSNRYVGGAETSLELIAAKMAELGEHICFATVSIAGSDRFGKKNINSEDPTFRRKKINNITVYNLSSSRWPSFEHLNLKQREQFVAYQKENFIAEIIESEKIDLAHSYEVDDTCQILKVKERLRLNIKTIQRIAGFFWAHAINSKLFTREQVEWVFNSIDAVNFLTLESRELFFQTAEKYNLKLLPKKEIILDIGINLDLFPYCWKPKTQGTFRIVSVLRFAFYQKRPDLLIRALSKVKHKDFIVDFIGVGVDLENCKILCHQLGISDRFIFHGYLDQSSIVQILSQADLFVLPSLFEGLPKALLEAMAVGVPCLVSDVMPTNQYIQEGANGFLAGNTAEEWADKLDFIYEQRGKFSQVVERAREFVAQNYDADKNILKYREEFRGLIQG